MQNWFDEFNFMNYVYDIAFAKHDQRACLHSPLIMFQRTLQKPSVSPAQLDVKREGFVSTAEAPSRRQYGDII